MPESTPSAPLDPKQRKRQCLRQTRWPTPRPPVLSRWAHAPSKRRASAPRHPHPDRRASRSHPPRRGRSASVSSHPLRSAANPAAPSKTADHPSRHDQRAQRSGTGPTPGFVSSPDPIRRGRPQPLRDPATPASKRPAPADRRPNWPPPNLCCRRKPPAETTGRSRFLAPSPGPRPVQHAARDQTPPSPADRPAAPVRSSAPALELPAGFGSHQPRPTRGPAQATPASPH